MGLHRGLRELLLRPQIRRKESVRARDGSKRGLDKVAERLGVASGVGVHILDTGERQKLLRALGSDNASAARRRHQAHTDGAALASDLSCENRETKQKRK